MRDSTVLGSYQDQSANAGVRCCAMNGLTCVTPGDCRSENENAIIVSYAEANSQCNAFGHRLCTKDEMNSGICCGTGGQCDYYPIWTSTPELGTYRHLFL